MLTDAKLCTKGITLSHTNQMGEMSQLWLISHKKKVK
jgi:hypothetical protein